MFWLRLPSSTNESGHTAFMSSSFSTNSPALRSNTWRISDAFGASEIISPSRVCAQLIGPLNTTPVAIVTGDYFLEDSVANELRELGAELRFKPLWLEDLIALAKILVSA